MKNLFKVGCNFDFALIDKAVELNQKYDGVAQIKEWFGSDSSHADTAARPNWRLQNISEDHLKEFVRRTNDAGMIFNWTMNSINPYGTKIELVNHKKDIQDHVKYLEDIGVKRITVANPMLAMFIREVSDISIEASCIFHIDSVTQMKYLHETLGFDKFCNNILKNRDKLFLKNAAKYCNENGCVLELLANEFCWNNGVDKNGVNYAAPCIYRDSCYICHGSCKTKEETMSYNNYPMQFCMGSRNGNQEGWLRSRWIRPQDLHYYNDIGVNYFKISGRTGGTEAIIANMEAYMSQKLSGNLLQLWKPLQSIYNGKSEKEVNDGLGDYIDIEKLDGFLDHWFGDEPFYCEDQICGTTCTYCKDFYEKCHHS